MALTATIHQVEIDLADNDRNVYETLSLRVARHPSESEEYLLTRVLAYVLEYEPGIGFSKGLSDPDEPAVSVRDPTGRIVTWIEIGTPDAARLHRASKAASRVVVYVQKDPAQFLGRLAGERIHRADAIAVWAVDRPLLAALVERLDRRMAFSLAVTDRELYVAIGDVTLAGTLTRHALA